MAIFTQDKEPYPRAGGDLWIVPTTGDVFARNTSNTAWNIQFNMNPREGGLLARYPHSPMSGPLTGLHALAPLDSPEFSTSLKLGGSDVATVDYLTKKISDTVKTFKTGTVSGATTSVKMTTKIAVSTGFVTVNVAGQVNTNATMTTTPTSIDFVMEVSDFPKFKNEDGTFTTATKSQCNILVSPSQWKLDTFGNTHSGNVNWRIVENTTFTTAWRYQAYGHSNQLNGNTYRGIALMYMVFATRN